MMYLVELIGLWAFGEFVFDRLKFGQLEAAVLYHSNHCAVAPVFCHSQIEPCLE
jgi:hypothetical protein